MIDPPYYRIIINCHKSYLYRSQSSVYRSQLTQSSVYEAYICVFKNRESKKSAQKDKEGDLVMNLVFTVLTVFPAINNSYFLTGNNIKMLPRTRR